MLFLSWNKDCAAHGEAEEHAAGAQQNINRGDHPEGEQISGLIAIGGLGQRVNELNIVTVGINPVIAAQKPDYQKQGHKRVEHVQHCT